MDLQTPLILSLKCILHKRYLNKEKFSMIQIKIHQQRNKLHHNLNKVTLSKQYLSSFIKTLIINESKL